MNHDHVSVMEKSLLWIAKNNMKQHVKCYTIAEFDACIAAQNIAECINLNVVLWESSSAELWESSSAEASNNVFLRLFSALKIKAAASVVVLIHGKAKSLIGGKQIKVVKPKTVYVN